MLGIRFRRAADNRSHARSCGCVRRLLQSAHRLRGDFSGFASRLRTGIFLPFELCSIIGLSGTMRPKTARASDFLVRCSPVVAGAPQTQQVGAFMLWATLDMTIVA